MTKGFLPNEQFEVRITDLAILSMLDIAMPNLANRSGLDSIFIAPELKKSSFSHSFDDDSTTPFGVADVWSLGVMLYLLMVGDLGPADGEQSFTFEEDAWEGASEDIAQFIELCLEPDSNRR